MAWPWRGAGRKLLDQEPILQRHGLGKAAGFDEVVEADDHVDPVMRRRQRHLGLDDDAVGAIGMRHLEDVGAFQIQLARLGLAGDDLQSEDRAQRP